MKFDYAPLETTERFGLRWYFDPRVTDPEYSPSITTVLSKTMSDEKRKILSDWRERVGDTAADEVSESARTRGSAMHDALEKLTKGERVDLDALPENARALFNSLRPMMKHVTEVWGAEVALRSKSLGVAGRCDLVCAFKGIPSIVDYKTSNWPKKRSDIDDYFVQTSFYTKAHNEEFGTDIRQGIILIGVERGLPQTFVIDVRDYARSLDERVAAFYEWAEKEIVFRD